MIAVILLTCDRIAYTERTLATFAAQNPRAREEFVLLHADDGSADRAAVTDLAAGYGFASVVAHVARQGRRATAAQAIAAASQRGADWVLLLENDWEWARPFPWGLFTYVTTHHPDVYTLRLYGQHKGRHRRIPCALRHLGKPQRPAVRWLPLAQAPEAAEVASIHWGAPPSVTRLTELRQLYASTESAPGTSDLIEIRTSGTLDGLTARPVANVVYHIGDLTTPPTTETRGPVRYDANWQAKRRWTQDGSRACLVSAFTQLGRPASLLDVGRAEGHLVQHAAQQGIHAIGVDVSVTAESDSLRSADLREPLDLQQQFACVLCWEVAEHLPHEAAETLCDSLVRHLTPDGVLLFTAATPGQGGSGHVNEQLPAYWQSRLETRGLIYDREQTAVLRRQWLRVASRTPWYGRNLLVYRGAAWTTPAPPPLPTLAVSLRTVDRSPRPNYLGRTVRGLLAQGIPPSAVHVCSTSTDVRWLDRELAGAPISLHVPERLLTPNENGLQQIAVLDPSADWALLLEDDLEFCADFLGSVQRWLTKVARPDRHVYRLFGFGVQPPSRTVSAYDWKLRGLCGSQAVALRMTDAQHFLQWSRANLQTWGGFRGDSKIAFDKLIASWALATWPSQPGVVSQPLFVRHIGLQSSIHARAIGNDRLFGGAMWRYA